MSSLVVHLNRGELYAVEPTTSSASVDGPFALELRNHGQAIHVHLRLDDALARVADLNGTNLFVDTESVVTVPVEVADGAPTVEGTVTIVSGYGKGEDHVEVRLVDEDEDGVHVDDDLGRPERTVDSDDADERDSRIGRGSFAETISVHRPPLGVLADAKGALLVGVLILVALAISGVALLAAPGLAVVLGILAVLVGIGVAAYVMVR